MLGPDVGAGLSVGASKNQYNEGKLVPNLDRLGRRVAQLHGGAANPSVGRRHLVRFVDDLARDQDRPPH